MAQVQNIQRFRKLVDEPLATWPGALVVVVAVLGVGFVVGAAYVGPLDDYSEAELAQTLPILVTSFGALILAGGVIVQQVAGAMQLRIAACARAVERLSEPTTATPTTPADDALLRRFAGELAEYVDTVTRLRGRLGLARRISAGLVCAGGVVLAAGAVLSSWALPVLT
jgi:hypothetical protein